MTGLQYTLMESIEPCVKKLRKQFNTHITKDLKFRKQQLENILRLINENKKDIDEAIWKDLRKSEMECYMGETSLVIEECKYMIKNLQKFAKPTHTKKRFLLNAADKTYIRKEAKGVVLIIGPWNYPVNLLLLPIIGAIAAGNCVIAKPSEVAAHTAELFGRLLTKYLDQRTFAVINGGVKETTLLLEQKFDHIFYTGNGQVGKIIMAAAAKHLTPISLELGGKSPVIISPESNLEVVANRIAWGKFFNNGQTCVAPDYILITKHQVEPFVELLHKAIVKFYGEDPQKSESYGRIINERQFDRLKAILDKINPASIAVGGKTDKDDLYISPTIISPCLPDDSHIMQEEIFGPILPIIAVEDIEEAISIVNSKEHSLALYIFTDKNSTYEHILENTCSGGALVNDVLLHFQELSLPFGGIGPSGLGGYHGEASFKTFTHERSTMVKSSGLESINAVRYPPYNNDKLFLSQTFLGGLPASLVSKLSSIFKLFAALYKVLIKKKSN
ncbi:Aldehyde/histidinol dehydrogenase [Spinellus fusiger]|nr:Aldehyde/histidinol dehydrogenase [Spinellus fusiger]